MSLVLPATAVAEDESVVSSDPDALAACAVGAFWLTTCVCADPPDWVESSAGAVRTWSADWLTLFAFVPVTVLDCVGIQTWISDPSAPDPLGSGAAGSTETRTSPLADCVVGAACVRDCDCPAWDAPPVCICVAPWLRAFAFVATAFACEELVCETGASSPGLL